MWKSASDARRGYLDRALDPLEHSQAHDCPGGKQTANDVRVEGARVVDAVRDIQRFTVPKVGRGGVGLAFFFSVDWKGNTAMRMCFLKN